MPDFRMKIDHGMSPEILQAIGDFVVSFAEIEYSLKLGIQTLLSCSIPHKGIITADKSVSQLIEMLRELYRTSDNQRVPFETIDQLCNEAEQIRSFRNYLMHATLTAVDHETVELEKRKRGRKFELKVKEFNITQLNEITEQAKYVAGDLIGIWMGYYEITPRVV